METDEFSQTPPPERTIALPWRVASWFIEGARTGLFLAPRWAGLRTDATVIFALVALNCLLTVIFERLYIVGAARFYWQAIAGGWFSVAASAWACYLIRSGAPSAAWPFAAPDTAHLITLVLAQAAALNMALGLMFSLLVRSDAYLDDALGDAALWALWLAPAIWMLLAELMLLWRAGSRRRSAMTMAALAITGGMILAYAIKPVKFWYEIDTEAQAEAPPLNLTQQLMEAQLLALQQRLGEIAPQRRGVIDLYAMTFAPYSANVFRRESQVVADVMAERYDARGRVLQLVNHAATAEQWPWATTLNFRRAIQHVANIMDPAEDILFIHLTSHGARDGELAANFWPLEINELRPADLKLWLDEAGIRYRVISVSACYSGSWIAPLADENTLVVTAADASHTSYGCGRKSELTFFGRAMYDEQLRTATLSFEEAYRNAHGIVKQREKEAGKTDGFSNPQLRVGSKIRERLAALQARLPNARQLKRTKVDSPS